MNPLFRPRAGIHSAEKTREGMIPGALWENLSSSLNGASKEANQPLVFNKLGGT